MWLFLRNSERTRLILVNDKEEILVVRGWIASSNHWNLPGGGLHRGEKPMQGVLRETYEEIGLALTPENLRFFGMIRSTSKGLSVRLHVFTATVMGNPGLRLQRHEIAVAHWVSLSELTPDNTDQDVLQALKYMAAKA
jgi:8-oxo-dGTP pyrophosphatase MutT (NUDIX family)